MIDAQKITAIRNERILFEDLSFYSGRGDIVHIRGNNGAGKTTLMRMLCALSRPQRGKIRWDGVDIYENPQQYCQKFIYVGHDNGLKSDLTVAENIHFDRTIRANQSQHSISEVMQRLGIQRYANVPCRYLSAGQKRRVALSRIVASDAILWFLDEPFTALDETAQELVVRLLAEHQKKGGASIVTSHQPVQWDEIQVDELNIGEAN